LANIEKNTSEQILTAAFKCIAAKGYANVSMRDIAEEAGVALSQLNYYFKNKEGLFHEVIKVVQKRYLQHIEENLSNIPNQKDKVIFLADYCTTLIKQDTSLYRLLLDLFSMAMWHESFRQEMIIFFEEVSEVISRHISVSSESSALYNNHPDALIRMVLAAVFGTAMQYLLTPEDNILISMDIFQTMLKESI
jgi:AcrR family transcriptional regulator